MPEQNAHVVEQPKAMTNETLLTPKVPETPTEKSNFAAARQEGAVLYDDAIIARPLALPGLKVKLKNPEMIPFWANRVAKGGRRVFQLKAAGYKVCHPDDVINAGGVETSDGQFVNDDLLLMMAPRAVHLGALKHNAQIAHDKLTTAQLARKSRSTLDETLGEVQSTSAMRQKISMYVPEATELGQMLGVDPKEVTLSETGQGR
jgi:hypothetical protein